MFTGYAKTHTPSMEVLSCGHVAHPGRSRLCRHLTVPEAPTEHLRMLTGEGINYDLCCPACDRDGAVEYVVACEGCVQRIEDERYDCLGWRGQPGIRERAEPLDPTIVRTRLPVAALDAAPVADRPHEWLLLTADEVLRWHARDARTLARYRVTLPALPTEEPWNNRVPAYRLHAAPDGRFAAIVIDYGTRGLLLDLTTGLVALRLDRDDYHSDTTPFPCAFVTGEQGSLLVHATRWNRLDIHDLTTGRSRSHRSQPRYERTKPLPPHYLDYFHGALCPSPGGRWIADDGWAWHPVGIPVLWGVPAWLDNPYESEDGPSRRELCLREYHWDTPMCWIDEHRLAVSGLGDDGGWMLPGVRLFEPATGREVATFAGPSGPLHCNGHRLYSSGEDGLEIWDPDSGERTGRVPGFRPTRYHPGSGELAALHESSFERWRPPLPGSACGTGLAAVP
jgi:hypothetical protein